jgi:hypothetical protein
MAGRRLPVARRRLPVALGALALALAACGTPPAPPRPSAGAGATAAPQPSAGAGTTAPASSPADPSPVASAPTLIAFVLAPTAGTGGAAEVTGPDQLPGLVGGPPEAVESARAAVAHHSGTGNRLFAFVLSGCRNTGAALTIQTRRITATLTGGEGTACFAAEWYLAVFALPAALVPPGTRVG